MALYPHVRSKDDLLDGLVGRLLTEVALPNPESPWRARLRELAHSMRAVAQRHPAVVPLLYTRPAITADGLRVVDTVYAVLMDSGVPDDQVARIERLNDRSRSGDTGRCKRRRPRALLEHRSV